MTSISDRAVIIQTSAELVPSTPSWFGEVALLAGYLRKHGVLSQINERVRLARRRGVSYEVIDFLAVLLGYAINGKRTLEAFYERLQPFAVPFMALFERGHFPARSTLSRFLVALTETPVEALRTLFLDDLESRPLSHEKQIGGLTDRAGNLPSLTSSTSGSKRFSLIKIRISSATTSLRNSWEQELQHAERVITTIKEEGFWDGHIHNS